MDPIRFYTVDSKEENRFTPYVRQIQLYAGTKKSPRYIPTKRYVFPEGGRTLPEPRRMPGLEYMGSPTPEQAHILNVLKTRRDEYSYGCGLVRLGTGKGKSHVIMQLVVDYSVPTLILTHNVKTLKEMEQKFYGFVTETRDGTRYRMETGLWYGKEKRLAPITVATHDSFVLAGGKLGDFQMVIVDECDTNLSKPFITALCDCGADYLYGLTGTAYRKDLDNNDLQKIYGKEVAVAGSAYEFKPRVEMVSYRSAKYEYETFTELKSLMVADEDRLATQVMIVEKLRDNRNCVLVLTERVEEAEAYASRIKDSILITGKTKEKDDEENLKRVYEGRGHVIVGTVGKMSRGVDVPPIDTVCMFCAVHFQGTVVQAVGRAMRKHPGKVDVQIVDWSDSAIRKQAYGRKAAYVKEYSLNPDTDVYKFTAESYLGLPERKPVRQGKGVPGTVPGLPQAQLMLGT